MNRFLIIQTAFTGDVVLATALAEKLHQHFPGSPIDFVVRKGNEGLLAGHPYLRQVLVWDKKGGKYKNLLALARAIRQERYTHVINPHRFGASGFLTLVSGAAYRAGFDKNPFSFSYTLRVRHTISAPYTPPVHEVQRNQELIAGITDGDYAFPRLYPSPVDYAMVQQYQGRPYICIAPSSVWFTKQFPEDKWTGLVKALPTESPVYLIGAPGDAPMAERIVAASGRQGALQLCGKLSFLQSAALMASAEMNYTNDSAPLHFATALSAPVTAVFCSTVPAFGFGPLRNNGRVVEIAERLSCRPCGLHGKKECPEGHFRCAREITNEQLLWWTLKKT